MTRHHNACAEALPDFLSEITMSLSFTAEYAEYEVSPKAAKTLATSVCLRGDKNLGF